MQYLFEIIVQVISKFGWLIFLIIGIGGFILLFKGEARIQEDKPNYIQMYQERIEKEPNLFVDHFKKMKEVEEKRFIKGTPEHEHLKDSCRVPRFPDRSAENFNLYAACQEIYKMYQVSGPFDLLNK